MKNTLFEFQFVFIIKIMPKKEDKPKKTFIAGGVDPTKSLIEIMGNQFDSKFRSNTNY